MQTQLRPATTPLINSLSANHAYLYRLNMFNTAVE